MIAMKNWNTWSLKALQFKEKWAPTWENRIFAYAKTKTQISFAVTAKLINVFVFATRIVQSLYYLNPKFQVPRHLLWLYSPVCVGPGRKPRRPVFWRRGSNDKKYRFSKLLVFHHANNSVKWIPPYTPLLYSKTGVYRGLYYFLLFLLNNIDCGYSLEPPHWV